MRTAIFFVSLLFLLSGGNNSLYANSHSNNRCYIPTGNAAKRVASLFTNLKRGGTFIASSNETQEEKYLICDDVDDEDTSDYVTRKFRSQCQCKILRIFKPVVAYHNYQPGYEPYAPYVSSCKYILQRALRI